jgi:hypothetical protein
MHPTRLALVVTSLLAACAAPAPALAGGARHGPWSVQVVDEAGRPLPTFQQRGRTYVLGTLGQRYLLQIRNGGPRRIEVVASVDGRDVVDGRPAALQKRGYLVDPWDTLTVDGFRVSDEAVAAFRFSSVPRSYAARMGDARDVGVVGVAVFTEAAPRPLPPPPYRPYSLPYDGEEHDRSDEAPGSEAAPGPGAAAPAGSGSGEARAEAKASRDAGARADERRGLGTEFGEAHASAVTHVPFERASAAPAALLTVRYDDRAGLVSLGIDVDGRGDDAWLRATATPFRGYAEPPRGWRP